MFGWLIDCLDDCLLVVSGGEEAGLLFNCLMVGMVDFLFVSLFDCLF